MDVIRGLSNAEGAEMWEMLREKHKNHEEDTRKARKERQCAAAKEITNTVYKDTPVHRISFRIDVQTGCGAWKVEVWFYCKGHRDSKNVPCVVARDIYCKPVDATYQFDSTKCVFYANPRCTTRVLPGFTLAATLLPRTYGLTLVEVDRDARAMMDRALRSYTAWGIVVADYSEMMRQIESLD